MTHQTVWILDFGSQYTQLIARCLREESVYCEIRPCTDAAPQALPDEVIGVILSGGPASVLGDDAPPFDERWLGFDVPLLGICYGMQLLTNSGGGSVERGTAREYGRAEILIEDDAGPLFLGLGERFTAWMSHGDHVARPPQGFRVAARSASGVIAGIASEDGRRFGLQLHPEVTHTDDGGALLRNFLAVCGARLRAESFPGRAHEVSDAEIDAFAEILAQTGATP